MENPTRNNIKFSYCIIFSHYVNLDSEFFSCKSRFKSLFWLSNKNIKNKFKCSLWSLYSVTSAYLNQTGPLKNERPCILLQIYLFLVFSSNFSIISL